MEAHPGIYFRSGPSGRRAAVIGGPDVWEIARVLRDVHVSGEKAIARTAQLLGRSEQQVRAAAEYYANYKDEIDAWIALVDELAADAEASWRRQRSA